MFKNYVFGIFSYSFDLLDLWEDSGTESGSAILKAEFQIKANQIKSKSLFSFSFRYKQWLI
jgi:hypothetical protein